MTPCEEHSSVVRGLGNIEGKLDGIATDIKRLDIRVNGVFTEMGEHIKEAPAYRDRIISVERDIKYIKEEKLNSVKNSQWRIGLIVGCSIAILQIGFNFFMNNLEAKSFNAKFDKQLKVSSDNNRILKETEK